MNKKLGLAVAGALLALSSTANAGITIPAGDWTVDISGNINAFATSTKYSGGTTAITGGLAGARDANGENRTQGINTGLLPAWLSIGGKTRQNDLDVAFAVSFQPNVSDNTAAGDNNTPLNRQAYMTVGDASWGSVKLGKDIGIFASDAILNDMTLLGVGGLSGNSGTATTLGGIGSGYIYAAWKGQIAYTTPNWNGFQATVGITNPNQGFGSAYQDRYGFEGKASYAWTGDVAGKVWASFASNDVTTSPTAAVADTYTPSGTAGTAANTLIAGSAAVPSQSYTATVFDIGANVNVANFGLTGYYYNGEGAGTTLFGNLGATAGGKKRDSDGGYVQATYTLPTTTKLGFAYGVSNLDKASGEADSALVKSNRRYTVGVYHPLTKSVNLVAEYNDIEAEAHLSSVKDQKSKAVSLGAIMFF